MNTANLIHASGHLNLMPAWENSRRFWVIDDRQIDDTPPTNWVGHLIGNMRCKCLCPSYSATQMHDYFVYATGAVAHGSAGRWSTRSSDFKCSARWDVRLSKTVDGRTWSTCVAAITDDFGWLVEVPTC